MIHTHHTRTHTHVEVYERSMLHRARRWVGIRVDSKITKACRAKCSAVLSHRESEAERTTPLALAA